MKKLFYILIMIASAADAQVINFSDPNFKSTLLSITAAGRQAYGNGGYIKVDANSDGEIQLAEAQAVDSLTLQRFNMALPNIANLTGISGFSNLKKLTCQGHSVSNASGLNNLVQLQRLTLSQTLLTALDVSMLTDLDYLYVGFNNNISSLNAGGLSNLRELVCRNNSLLTSLNLNGLTNLSKLTCTNNQLTGLNLISFPNLDLVDCTNNNITSLTLGNLNSLTGLICRENELTSLDLTGVPNLIVLDCGNNRLTALDLSGLSDLTQFQCDTNRFVSLDLSHNRLEELYCSDNPLLENVFMKDGAAVIPDYFIESFIQCPSLKYVCIDESENQAVMDAIDNAGLNNVIVNSYCSFVPGGDYNTISGTVTYDFNNNGCDASDISRSNIRVNINDGNEQGANFCGADGNYSFYTQAGSFDIAPSIENPSWFTISPASVTIPFANSNNNTAIQNFCITPNGVHPDLEIAVAPVNGARPGSDAYYDIVVKNKGNQEITDTNGIIFLFDYNRMNFVEASEPLILIGGPQGQLRWELINLQPFDAKTIRVRFLINTPTHPTHPVNTGDVLSFNATANPVSGDETPADNVFQLRQTVVNSHDPNNIVCLEGNIVSPSQIGNYLHYVINFENTGTADAQNIVIKEEVNPAQFNIASMQLLDSSANATTRIRGNTVEFIFTNINLHSGGHGNILLKIRSKDNLVNGDLVSKKANIYFDYNFPVETLPESTVFQQLSNPDLPMDASISVYPNPSSGIVNIKCDNVIRSVQLYDIQGRLLQTNLTEAKQEAINIATQSNGVYFLKIVSEQGIGIKKIVRE